MTKSKFFGIIVIMLISVKDYESRLLLWAGRGDEFEEEEQYDEEWLEEPEGYQEKENGHEEDWDEEWYEEEDAMMGEEEFWEEDFGEGVFDEEDFD